MSDNHDAIRQALAKLSSLDDLSVHQARLFIHLIGKPVEERTLKALMAALGISYSRLSGLIDKLAGLQLVTRERSPLNRAWVIVSLTERGERRAREVLNSHQSKH